VEKMIPLEVMGVKSGRLEGAEGKHWREKEDFQQTMRGRSPNQYYDVWKATNKGGQGGRNGSVYTQKKRQK